MSPTTYYAEIWMASQSEISLPILGTFLIAATVWGMMTCFYTSGLFSQNRWSLLRALEEAAKEREKNKTTDAETGPKGNSGFLRMSKSSETSAVLRGLRDQAEDMRKKFHLQTQWVKATTALAVLWAVALLVVFAAIWARTVDISPKMQIVHFWFYSSAVVVIVNRILGYQSMGESLARVAPAAPAAPDLDPKTNRDYTVYGARSLTIMTVCAWLMFGALSAKILFDLPNPPLVAATQLQNELAASGWILFAAGMFRAVSDELAFGRLLKKDKEDRETSRNKIVFNADHVWFSGWLPFFDGAGAMLYTPGFFYSDSSWLFMTSTILFQLALGLFMWPDALQWGAYASLFVALPLIMTLSSKVKGLFWSYLFATHFFGWFFVYAFSYANSDTDLSLLLNQPPNFYAYYTTYYLSTNMLVKSTLTTAIFSGVTEFIRLVDFAQIAGRGYQLVEVRDD